MFCSLLCVLSQSKSVLCCVTADHILFDVASLHSTVHFFSSAVCKVLCVALMPDTVLRHLHLAEEEGVGAELKVKFSIMAQFDMRVPSEGGRVRVKGGNGTQCGLVSFVFLSLSLHLTENIFNGAERERTMAKTG